MAVNDDLLEAITRRAVLLEQYKNGEWRKVRRLLRSVERDLVAQLEDSGIGRVVDGSRTERLLRSVRKIIADGADAFYAELNGSATALAQSEAEWVAGTLDRTVPAAVNWVAPAASVVRAAAVEKPFGMGERIGAHYLNGYVKQWGDRLTERATGAIRIGIIEGEGVEKIVSRLIGTQANNYADGVIETSRKSARTLVRTMTNHVANAARESVYEQYPDILRGVVWVSVLDSRTSIVCASRDGEVYPVGKGPRPPAHPNCRSTVSPVTRNTEQLQNRGVRVARNADGLNGEVPAEVDYETFLKRQPASFQDKVLGKTRADAFRNGARLDKFVNDEGRVLSLSELDIGDYSAELLSKKVRTADADARKYVLKRGKEDGVEHLVIVDHQTGDVVDRQGGGQVNVMPSEQGWAAMADATRQVVIHHNHPGDSSLSWPDIRSGARPGVKGVWAYGHKGSSYYAEIDAAISERVYKRVSNRVRNGLQRMVNDLSVTPQEASDFFNHLVWLNLDKMKLLRYSGNLNDAKQKRWEELGSALQKLVKSK